MNRPLRFSLKALLIFVTLWCVIFAFPRAALLSPLFAAVFALFVLLLIVGLAPIRLALDCVDHMVAHIKGDRLD